MPLVPLHGNVKIRGVWVLLQGASEILMATALLGTDRGVTLAAEEGEPRNTPFCAGVSAK